MRVQVSKSFAKFINETAHELKFSVTAKMVEMSRSMYGLHVDTDIFRAVDYNDYNINNGKFKAIMLTYPDSYCACNRFITTYELAQAFRRENVKTVEQVKTMIKNLCEI